MYKGAKNLAYTALYRKFRPLKFEDMVGEDHITTTLKNQIIADRVGHAYLFNRTDVEQEKQLPQKS